MTLQLPPRSRQVPAVTVRCLRPHGAEVGDAGAQEGDIDEVSLPVAGVHGGSSALGDDGAEQGRTRDAADHLSSVEACVAPAASIVRAPVAVGRCRRSPTLFGSSTSSTALPRT
jgi:hypothetical protein